MQSKKDTRKIGIETNQYRNKLVIFSHYKSPKLGECELTWYKPCYAIQLQINYWVGFHIEASSYLGAQIFSHFSVVESFVDCTFIIIHASVFFNLNCLVFFKPYIKRLTN